MPAIWINSSWCCHFAEVALGEWGATLSCIGRKKLDILTVICRKISKSQSTSNTVPRCTLPQPTNTVNIQPSENQTKSHSPTNLQCFSILLESATFSPTSVHAGLVSWIFAKSAFTLKTRPPVEVDPILMSSNSFLTSFVTLVCFLSSDLTPRRRRRRKRDISSSR